LRCAERNSQAKESQGKDADGETDEEHGTYCTRKGKGCGVAARARTMADMNIVLAPPPVQ
jgi:hypothetical protein